MTQACVLGKKTHHRRGQGGRTEIQDDSEGPPGGGCGLPSGHPGSEGLKDAGRAEWRARCRYTVGAIRESLTGEKPQGSPLWRRNRMRGDPGTQPGTPGHQHQSERSSKEDEESEQKTREQMRKSWDDRVDVKHSGKVISRTGRSRRRTCQSRLMA